MNSWTGPLPDLSEDLKTFVDDLPDYTINAISKRYYPPSLETKFSLRNKHMALIAPTYQEMIKIKTYCTYLIEIGAVKDESPAAEAV